MGLDTVELVMATEEEFGIEIPDQDASRLETAGEIADYVIVQLRAKGGAATAMVDADAVWERVKALIVWQLGVKPERVTRNASIVRDLGAD